MTVQAIDKIRRSFFWKELDHQDSPCRKLHAVRWEAICQLKQAGGLGIGRLEEKNESLLAKWWWRFGKEKDSLWRKILVGKYGEDCLHIIWQAWKSGVNVKVSPVMKNIISISDDCFEKCCSRNCFKWVLGNGKKVDFWSDNWHRMGILKEHLHVIYNNVANKAVTIHQLLNLFNPSSWEEYLNISMLSTTEACYQLDQFLNIINEIQLLDREDKIIWSNNQKSLSTAAVYQLLANELSSDRKWSFYGP